MAWVAVIGAGGAIAGGLIAKSGSSSTPSGTQTTTQQTQLDPRISGAIFGDGSANSGLVNKYTGMLGTPQNSGIAAFGGANDGYLAQTASNDQNHIRAAAYNQIDNGVQAPTMGAAQVNAPSQNGINLTGSYDKFINGDAGANPYLTSAIQGGIDQSTNQFRQMQSEATDNLQRNVLPGVRSNAVLAGQYGSSRQGVAEGNAISDMTKQLNQSMTQFGQNNTNAAVGAQAQSFNAGQDRALAATQGLGAQQYGVAGQNAAFQQGADANNVSALLQTNGLNAANTQNGMSNLNGLLSSAYNIGQNQDSYALNQAGKVNGLLSPYLSANSTSTTSQPLYSNTAGNMLGGAAAGLGIAKQIGNLFGQGGSPISTAGQGVNGGGPAGTYYDGYAYVPIGQ